MRKYALVIVLSAVALTGCVKQQEITANVSKTPEPKAEIPQSAPALAVPARQEEAPAASPVPNKPALQAAEPAPPAPAVGRVWTASDGRTLEAEMVSRTADSVTVRRNADNREFTIPLKNLSNEDRAYVQNSTMPVTVLKQFDSATLAQLKASVPQLSAQAPLESNYATLVDLYGKYKRRIEFISETGYERHLKMLRQEMESDIKRLQPVAATSLNNAPVYSSSYGWSKGSGAWRDAWAARSALAWLQGPLNQHMSQLEQLK